MRVATCIPTGMSDVGSALLIVTCTAFSLSSVLTGIRESGFSWTVIMTSP